jgi:hypothetical protein
MGSRIKTSTEWLRHDFSAEEKLQMGYALAESYNTLNTIDEEEAVVKSQFKERRMSIEQKVGSLSRELASGFKMANFTCELVYDCPNVGEVSYKRQDNGAIVKTRPMTESERQQEIPFDTPVAVNPQTPEETAEAIASFIEKNGGEGALEAVTEALIDTFPAIGIEDPAEALALAAPFGVPEAEAARQVLITMGDAKKAKKKKAKEPAPEPLNIVEAPVDEDYPF